MRSDWSRIMSYLAISYHPERADYNTEAVSDEEPNKIKIKYSCSDNHLRR